MASHLKIDPAADHGDELVPIEGVVLGKAVREKRSGSAEVGTDPGVAPAGPVPGLSSWQPPPAKEYGLLFSYVGGGSTFGWWYDDEVDRDAKYTSLVTQLTT